MDDLCSLMEDIKVSTEILLNVDTWQQDQIDSYGIYKELITRERLYKVYSYGVYVARRNGFEKIKHARLEEQNGDIVVIAY